MSKLPAFQFYPADWRKSSDIQALSFHDRGIWFEILCLMHESEDRGRLVLNGKPMSDEIIAKYLGISRKKLQNSLKILLEFGVAFRDNSGALCNRRMIRDEQIRRVRTASGKLGGNPALVNQNSTKEDKQKTTPSSSSSSSKNKSKNKSANKKPQTLEDLIAEQETNPEFAQINVRKEAEDAARWIAKRPGREFSKRFFVAWLKRADVPIDIPQKTKSQATEMLDPYGRPIGTFGR